MNQIARAVCIGRCERPKSDHWRDKVVSMHAHVDPSLMDCIGGRLGRWALLGRHLLLRAAINFVENHAEFSP